jgi:hypothetical protein
MSGSYNVKTHGISGYTAGCRCETCTAANAADKAARRSAAFLAGSELGGRYRHGTRYSYELRGCRCEVCVPAQQQRGRDRRAKEKRKGAGG